VKSNVDTSEKPKVLVVDDMHSIADTLVTILIQNGLDAMAVYGGLAAVEHCNNSEPDIVVSDVAMPDLDGVQTAMAIRRSHPNCKILLCSGQAITNALLEPARRGGQVFELVAKPVAPQEMVERVLRQLAAKRAEAAGGRKLKRCPSRKMA
jgi:DNA-binding NtrC family response regulator